MKKRLFKSIKIGVAMGLIVISGLIMTGFTSKNFEIAKHLDVFTTLFRELVLNYVDEVNPSEIIKTGIDEMLYTLDPYTNFISESQIEDVRFMTTGQYGGIGALIHSRDEYVYISEPYEGFPAFKSGLKAGDKILEIDGQPVRSLAVDEVRTLLQGQPGTSVVLKIERIGEAGALIKTLTREVVTIDNIPYYGMLDEHTGYIKLNGFTQHAGREVREAFNTLRSGNDLRHLVLDLRGNGGGLLHEAVNITNLFVEKNKLVVSTKGRIADRNTTHHTLNDPIDMDIPIAILVDRQSASASEIVAGAIQDFDRGVVVGQRTFGKGLVQNVVPLSYNTQLKVTVAKYYIPSGRSIQAIDYAQRNEDGSVAMIPDSLKVAFTTLNGRIVYDGGGIEPDIFHEPKPYGQVTIALMRQFMVFDYANHFYRNNESIAPAETFAITDKMYQEFIDFVKAREFDYTTESERHLERLKEISKGESYFSSIEDEFERLKNTLLHNKEEDLITYRDEISLLLKEEIATRYYHQKGRVLSSLSTDSDIEETLKLFADKDRYSAILSGK